MKPINPALEPYNLLTSVKNEITKLSAAPATDIKVIKIAPNFPPLKAISFPNPNLIIDPDKVAVFTKRTFCN